MLPRRNYPALAAVALLALVLAGSGLWMAAAQEATPQTGPVVGAPQADPVETAAPTEQPTDPPPPPPVYITTSEPTQVTSGIGGTISVFGGSFTADTRVRLVGYGLLETQFVNPMSLTAKLPEMLSPGEYQVEVTDPIRSSAPSPNRLRVVPPPATEGPAPTERPLPTETTPPTITPGQPSLLVRGFSANPAVITPGGGTLLTFEVVNQGSRPAQGVSVSLDSGGKFVPANGQSGATLPDLPMGAAFTVSLAVVSAMDTPEGPASIPITFSYHDFEGQSYTSTATLSVGVRTVAEASQVTLSRYMTEPNPVVPGEAVKVTVLIMNTGNDTALQVLLRVAGDKSVLLAGPQGDSFPLGDLAPGASSSIELPLIVRADADAGPQSQPVTISYLSDGERKETVSAMTINVADVIEPKPLLLLDSYDVGRDVLQPGDRFTLRLGLKNVGEAPAGNLLVTFGSVESSSDSGGDSTGGSGGGSSRTGGSSTSTTPSSTFAPLGAGGTVYIGAVAADGGEVSLEQEFIVNGTVDSGIYGLPVTLRYTLPNGESAQENLRASVVVVAPPKLQTRLQMPLPEPANMGEPFPVALELANTGTTAIELREATVEVDQGEVLEGASTLLGPLAGDGDAMVNALVMPAEEGPVRVTVTLHYINDLNQRETLVLTYDTEAVAPPPPPEETPPMEEPVEPVEEPQADNTLGRLLLGFLGLGS